ncbi:MAG: hypothetical protein COX81_00795 [Candidatus Magasanikbacteria bacterium CG_4_10_14_0_2_um_filter_37_12]|uniref:Uncharacterized protein n=1 Tax=Candidatus Magasanikbacteria bacterium CG_4_10_14_0_2_um_filter_37_12 TaxID=1974637 RepID=A0A2M7V9D2_9BACT|nr:MAG: hypothetical protein COX81_00795 [Candidatus Magasanikbacteria bacterium CG_4_10_14_0_2_um_filter_37_12]
MFNTSQDLLYIVLSLSILWFTVFLCWLLYQAARVLRNANEIIENLTHKLEIISDAVEFIRAKVDKATDHMGAVSKFVSGTVGKLVMNKFENAFETKLINKDSKINKKKRKEKKM